MKMHRLSLTVFVLFLASTALITACQETASRFTDRTIQNLEDEVGGAAERSSERAADQAGGAICGSNGALILLFAGAPAFFALRRTGSSVGTRAKHRIFSLFNQNIRAEKRQKEENNGRY
jgi:uncharacterized BrkB/YihY/UPF0761 family membrane protein